jgi:hypothetical protein
VPILSRVQLPDSVLAKVIYGLSHEPDDGSRRGARYINYRDLSVQQLGAVYERILEYGLRATEASTVEIDADDQARHKSGSYYTPEELVSLIIKRAVGPLVAERIEIFRSKAEELSKDRRPVTERLTELEGLDPASAILSLKICDPAMGSGHFLVSLVDWLSDRVLDAKEEASTTVTWGEYISPLTWRIKAVRDKILTEAFARKWPIVEAQLDDRHMVLKRAVYGVDKNPMAVELAKVALWLHSFTVGAPLSFLDHHLRAGDSVLGGFVRPTLDMFTSRGLLLSSGVFTRLENIASVMAEIEETTDNDIAEVHASKAKFSTVEDATAPLASLFSMLTAERLMGVFDNAPARVRETSAALIRAQASEKAVVKAKVAERDFERAQTFQVILEGTLGDPVDIASGRINLQQNAQTLALPPVDKEGFPEEDDQLALPGLSGGLRRKAIAAGLVRQAKALADQHGFFHWEIGFPNVWSNLTSASPRGGFNAIIGNPPYVRQELLGLEVKRALKGAYAAFDGMADLYVYFYEQGLRLLKPGGRMSYVVTNKWLKAGYAEELRGVFADKAWLEFIADFGHAKHFFADADVFPSVLVVRKPILRQDAPVEADICVIPRDLVPKKGLEGAVEEATFPLPRAIFTREAWVLEPKPVMDLLEKVRRNGVPLADYIGVKPLYGIKTGLNEAFLIDSAKRDKLVRADPRSANIIKPYLRGQDIERWHSPDSELYMLVLKSSVNYPWPWADVDNEADAEKVFAGVFPSLHAQMKFFEDTGINPKTRRPTGLRHREDQGKYWWELRSCDYYDKFEGPKLLIQRIAFHARVSADTRNTLVNDSAVMIPGVNPIVHAALNSPVGWYFTFRKYPHKKDEAIAMDISYIEKHPIPECGGDQLECASKLITDLAIRNSATQLGNSAMLDWLRHEFGLDKPGTALSKTYDLDADGFAAAVRKALPKSHRLSAAGIQRLKDEHRETVEPARIAAAEALALERSLSDLVNAAYGLTPEEVQLMWDTAPPRMPFTG